MKESEIHRDQFRTLLFEKRQALLETAANWDESAQTVELDQARVGRLSRMDAMQAQAMAQETQRRDRLELQRIQSALQRFESGDYGYCLRCGKLIAEQRLRVDPAATLCISCASAAEHE